MSNENLNTFVNIDNFKEELAAIQNSVVSSNSGISPIADTDSLSTITLTNEDICFEVDADNRTITIPSEYKNIGVYNDHNAQKIYMRVNRYFDDVDLTSKICVVLFVNPRGVESYSLTNVYTDGTNNEKIIVEWTITHEHTERAGTLTFALCFYHINNEDGIFDYRWSTIPTTGNILYGLDLVRGEFSSGGYDDLTIVVSMVEKETEDRIAADEELESKIAGKADSAALSLKADKIALEAKADKSYNSGFIGGTGAKLNGAGGTATGQNAQASSGAAAGQNAQASEGVAAGKNAYASHGASLGRDTKTLHGVAAGDGAQTVDDDGNPITAIQLGGGTNTEPNTAKFFDYTVMNADGTIPRERIPMSINRYDVSALPSKSQTYDFSDGVSKFVASNRSSVEVQDGVQLINIAANAGNTGQHGRADLDISGLTTTATEIIVEYDVFYDGGRWDIGFVNTAQRPGSSAGTTYDTAGVAFYTGMTDSLNNFYINGVNQYDTTLNNTWYHVKVDINMTAKIVAYTISVGNEVKFDGTAEIPDGISVVNGIEVYSWTQGTIKFDNIKINALYDVDENGLYVTDDGQYIYKDGEPVRVGFDDLSRYYTKSETDEVVGNQAQETTELILQQTAMCIKKHDKVTLLLTSGDPSSMDMTTITATAWQALEYAVSMNEHFDDKADAADVYTKSEIDTKLGEKLDKDTTIVTADSSSDLLPLLQDMSDFNSNDKSTLLLNMNDTMHNVAEAENDIADLQTDMADKIGKYDEISVEISSGVETVSTVWGALESGLRADELLSRKADKSDVYTKTQIDTKLGDKSDKPDVTDYLESGSALSVTMTDNNIATCPEVSTLSITMPTSYDVTYCSELSFSSGATPTALTYPESVVMIGMDCIDNVFAPVANKRYTLMTAYNGQSFVGYVTGYDMSV